MRLQITFTFDKVIENTEVFVVFMWINFCSELLNLLRIQQEEIGNAVPTKALHRLEEVVIFDLDIYINDICLRCQLHVQETSELCIKNIENLMSGELMIILIKIVSNL